MSSHVPITSTCLRCLWGWQPYHVSRWADDFAALGHSEPWPRGWRTMWHRVNKYRTLNILSIYCQYTVNILSIYCQYTVNILSICNSAIFRNVLNWSEMFFKLTGTDSYWFNLIHIDSSNIDSQWFRRLAVLLISSARFCSADFFPKFHPCDLMSMVQPMLCIAYNPFLIIRWRMQSACV